MNHGTVMLTTVLTLGVPACAPVAQPKGHGVDVPPGPCGHAIVALSSDYAATSVGILGFNGAVLDGTIVSSASTTTSLSEPFSGDVVSPTASTPNGIVLVDRTPAGVISWLDPPSGKILRQLSVSAGTDPQDYIELSPQKAYVSRFDTNLAATDPLKAGGDVVVIDPSIPKLLSRIDIAASLVNLPPGILAHPNRMLSMGDSIVLLVPTYSKNYQQTGDSLLLRIDPSRDVVVGSLTLPNLKACLGLSLSPKNDKLAVACSGAFDGTSDPMLSSAGVAIVDTTTFTISGTIAGTVLGQPPGFSIAWTDANTVVLPIFGSNDQGTLDHLVGVNLTTSAIAQVATSKNAFEFGEIRCFVDCNACFLTDGNQKTPRVRRYDVDTSGALKNEKLVDLGGAELPPRYLGVY